MANDGNVRLRKLPPTRLNRGNPVSFTRIAEMVGRERSYVYRCWIGAAKPGKALARELKKLGWSANSAKGAV